MEKVGGGEGFYMNNVKYTACPAAEGAAITSRHNKHSHILEKFGLKQKKDFEQLRDWIFADREDSSSDTLSQSSVGSDCSQTPSNGQTSQTNGSPGRGAEASTKFRSSAVHRGVLHKLRICIVDIQDKKKPEFKKKIESHGGKAILDLQRNKADILLLTQASGMNYQNARLWGVACIHPDWIEKSIDAMTLLPLGRYRVVENSENMPPPPRYSILKAINKGATKDEEGATTGCFKFGTGKKDEDTESKSGLSIRSQSEWNSTIGLPTASRASRIVIDSFNASTRF